MKKKKTAKLNRVAVAIATDERTCEMRVVYAILLDEIKKKITIFVPYKARVSGTCKKLTTFQVPNDDCLSRQEKNIT